MRTVVNVDVAGVRPRYAARYRQPQSDTTRVTVARSFKHPKRLKNMLNFGLWYSLAFILDDNIDHVGPHLQRDRGALAIFGGIDDQIDHASSQGNRTPIPHDEKSG